LIRARAIHAHTPFSFDPPPPPNSLRRSARDIQKWEYVPLGPFGAKNFATSISPWVVTLDALAPFRCATSAGTQHAPPPLAYLADPTYSSYDVQLEVTTPNSPCSAAETFIFALCVHTVETSEYCRHACAFLQWLCFAALVWLRVTRLYARCLAQVAIQGQGMAAPAVVCRSNFRNLYWTCKQQLVHHAVTGCNMQPGDLLGSGSVLSGCRGWQELDIPNNK
jgi:fumarylacetoacetase